MSAESPVLVRSFAVEHRTVTFMLPRPRPGAVAIATCEWGPDIPRRPLSRRERRQYEKGRAIVFDEFAKGLRLGRIGVFDT